ncbi:transaldolase [Candidatus Peregrinibacteria bacterium]|nr:transaldolase [Candidatus Peregrinibacteria bacterium]
MPQLIQLPLFIDSGDIKEIAKYLKMGLCHGVTTNPTILVKEGVTGGSATIKKRMLEIAKLIHPYRLSVELTQNDNAQSMLAEAKDIISWGAPNIDIKVPVHGPNGELDNLEVIHTLENEHDIRVNCTAIMSAQQGLLAALAGASYVSLFCGRVNNMGYDSREEVKRLRTLIDQYGLKSKIIAASTREAINIMEWILAGAHIVTIVPAFITTMLVHPYSKETVQMFLADAKKNR